MPFLNLDYNLITESSVQFLGQNTKVTYLNPGSKARVILDIINEKMSAQALQLEQNTSQAFLRFAQGQLLDYIGEVYGLQRYLSKKARISAYESNLYFYTLQPSFGAINNGQDIIVNARQVNISDSSIGLQSDAVYTNTDQIILPANERIVYFSTEAQGNGTKYNVGSNVLVFHDFYNYSDSRNGTLLVANDSPITYGRDTENDENFKFRIKEQTMAGEAANDTAIRTSLLGVAGISEVIKVKFPRGVGTADWIIRAVTTEVSTSLLVSAQRVISLTQAEGADNQAVSPITIGLALTFYLVYVQGTDAKKKNTVKQTVRTALTAYVNNLEIGEKLVIDQLVRVILDSSKSIESMGLPSAPNNFELISIYKSSYFDQSRLKRTLVKDYPTKYNERVIIEPNVSEPITIKDYN